MFHFAIVEDREMYRVTNDRLGDWGWPAKEIGGSPLDGRGF